MSTELSFRYFSKSNEKKILIIDLNNQDHKQVLKILKEDGIEIYSTHIFFETSIKNRIRLQIVEGSIKLNQFKSLFYEDILYDDYSDDNSPLPFSNFGNGGDVSLNSGSLSVFENIPALVEIYLSIRAGKKLSSVLNTPLENVRTLFLFNNKSQG